MQVRGGPGAGAGQVGRGVDHGDLAGQQRLQQHGPGALLVELIEQLNELFAIRQIGDGLDPSEQGVAFLAAVEQTQHEQPFDHVAGGCEVRLPQPIADGEERLTGARLTLAAQEVGLARQAAVEVAQGVQRLVGAPAQHPHGSMIALLPEFVQQIQLSRFAGSAREPLRQACRHARRGGQQSAPIAFQDCLIKLVDR